MPSDPPSRLSEMLWSPSCRPRPRIIQFSRSSESDEYEESDCEESELEAEVLESTVTGKLRLLFWRPWMMMVVNVKPSRATCPLTTSSGNTL